MQTTAKLFMVSERDLLDFVHEIIRDGGKVVQVVRLRPFAQDDSGNYFTNWLVIYKGILE